MTEANSIEASTRKALLAALESWGVGIRNGVTDETSLLRSGLLDSVALFNLSLWVEERIGKPVDPTTFDVANEWDSIASIVRFVNGGAKAPASVPLAHRAPLAADSGLESSSDPHSVEIVRYSPPLKDEIATLQTHLWSASRERNRAYFEWKYERNSYAREPLIYLAMCDGKVVGMRGFYGSLWETDNAQPPFVVYCADDLVILAEHQNRGIFARFTEVALPDLAARDQSNFLSLSALRITRLQSLATGSKSVGTMDPVSISRWAVGAVNKVQQWTRDVPVLWRLGQLDPLGTSAERAFARLEQAQAKALGGATISVARESRPAAMAGLVRRLGHDGRIRHVRDEAFFSWRFDSPLHEYRFVFAEISGSLRGYLIVQRGLSEYSNRHRVHIVDWEAETPRIGADLLASAMQWGNFPELVVWSACLSADKVTTLERAGFSNTDAEQTRRGLPCILVRATKDEATDADFVLGGRSLLDLANWDVRMAFTHMA